MPGQLECWESGVWRGISCRSQFPPRDIIISWLFSGNVDLTRILPFLGKTELQVLSVVGSFLLILTHAMTAYCTKEKVLVAGRWVEAYTLCPVNLYFCRGTEKKLKDELKDLWANARNLPSVIRQIVRVPDIVRSSSSHESRCTVHHPILVRHCYLLACCTLIVP